MQKLKNYFDHTRTAVWMMYFMFLVLYGFSIFMGYLVEGTSMIPVENPNESYAMFFVMMSIFFSIMPLMIILIMQMTPRTNDLQDWLREEQDKNKELRLENKGLRKALRDQERDETSADNI